MRVYVRVCVIPSVAVHQLSGALLLVLLLFIQQLMHCRSLEIHTCIYNS